MSKGGDRDLNSAYFPLLCHRRIPSLRIPPIVSEHPYFILFLFLAGKRLSDASIYVRIPPPQSERRDGFQSGFHTRGARRDKVEEKKKPPRFPLFFSLGTSCPKGHKKYKIWEGKGRGGGEIKYESFFLITGKFGGRREMPGSKTVK